MDKTGTCTEWASRGNLEGYLDDWDVHMLEKMRLKQVIKELKQVFEELSDERKGKNRQ